MRHTQRNKWFLGGSGPHDSFGTIIQEPAADVVLSQRWGMHARRGACEASISVRSTGWEGEKANTHARKNEGRRVRIQTNVLSSCLIWNCF